MMFSVAMKGSSFITRARMTFSYTIRPSHTFIMMFRIASTPRKASATDSRLLAESSSVRSKNWVPAVRALFTGSTITKRARALMRSQRMGLRL